MYEVGSVGLDLVTDLIVADLSPLEWYAVCFFPPFLGQNISVD